MSARLTGRQPRKVRLGWPFMLAAILILIFAIGVVWWQAILVSFLASFYVELTYS